MKYVSFFCTNAIVLCCCLLFKMPNVVAQRSILSEDINLKIKTKGKLLSPNKLILIVTIGVPEGWKLMVDDGYDSMWEDGIDTAELTLKFRKSPDYQIVDRLKADRKPGTYGFYFKEVTFVQTLKINTKKLPLFIDAELNLSLIRADQKDFAKVRSCCLLKVCEKRRPFKTINVGWRCEQREKVYLEDVMD